MMDLTDTPQPLQEGIKVWRTASGIACMRVHYSAEPNWRDPLWLEQVSQGYKGGRTGRAWKREMEIDFTSWAGDPVYSLFSTASIGTPAHQPALPLLRGWDFGYRHPAVTFHQYDKSRHRLVTLDEIYPVSQSDGGMTTVELVDLIMRYTASAYNIPIPSQGSTDRVVDAVDPAGNQKSDKSHYSDVEIMTARGLRPQFSVVGRKSRIQRLRQFIEVEGRYSIHRRCGNLTKALQGGYRYQEEGEAADPEMPDTSKKVQDEPYIHLIDSMEYVAAVCLDDAPARISVSERPRELPPDTELAELLLSLPAEQRQRIHWGQPGLDSYGYDYEEDPWFR